MKAARRSLADRWRGLASEALRGWLRPRSPVFIVVTLAAWLTATANLALWRALTTVDAGHSLGAVALGVPVVVFCATAALLSVTAWGGRWMKPIWLAVLVAAAVSQHFMLNFGVVIDATMLANVWHTNPGEARELLTLNLLGNVMIVAGLPAVWLVGVPVRRATWRHALFDVVALLAVALAAGAVATAVSFRTLAPLVRNHMELRYLPNPLTPLWSAGRLALRPLASRQSTAPPIVMPATLGPSHAVANAKPPLVVVIVGETARSDHFALNGYGRDTTPELARRGVFSFRNVWSCGTSTLASVPCMFSPLGQSGYGARKTESETLLDTLQAAGLAVLWIDNQAGCKSVCDRVPHVSTDDIRGTPEGKALCDAQECLDEALLVGIDERIARLPAERRERGVVVVLHMMGSHGPAYFRRSPDDRKPFRPECRDTMLGACDSAALINAYDNTIAYTDHVLARTVDWLKSRSGSAEAMLYVSDHGESLGEFGMFLHGLPYAFAPDVQKHVPLVLWMNEEMLRQRRVDAACLNNQLDQRLSHDNLYHSVLALADVKSALFAPSLDLLGPCTPLASR